MHNIFVSERDHYKWSKRKELICSNENIDEIVRKNALLALSFLEQEFGNSFLKINSINHPVKLKIANTAPWQIEEMIAFTETLRYLKETTNNYNKLLEKLISEQKSKIEGIPFIEVSKMLCKEKLRIEFIDQL